MSKHKIGKPCIKCGSNLRYIRNNVCVHCNRIKGKSRNLMLNRIAARNGGSKRCAWCREDLPASSFNRNKNKIDGLSDTCRSCRHDRYVRMKEKRIDSATKQCCRCGEELKIKEFSLDNSKPDKLSVRCKPCSKAYHQAKRLDVPAKKRGPKPKITLSPAHAAALDNGSDKFESEHPCACGCSTRYTMTMKCVDCSNRRNRENYLKRKARLTALPLTIEVIYVC